MAIQWFPGHMAKAKRQVAEKLKFVDIVFELVDARVPFSSRNPMLDQIIQQKPRLVLLNKTDLADPNQTQLWQTYFNEKGYQAIALNAKNDKSVKQIVPAAKQVLAEKLAREKEKGLKERPIKAMVLGIPNVGKSTLLNHLAGKKIASTGNRPGVTKGQQWLRFGSQLELLDTPGILWPKFEDPDVGKKLALTGAIKDDLLHLDDLALYELEVFRRFYPAGLKERYNLTEDELFMELPELLLKITAKRGFKDDYERVSELLINELRQGRLGRFTLDRYEELSGE